MNFEKVDNLMDRMLKFKWSLNKVKYIIPIAFKKGGNMLVDKFVNFTLSNFK